MNPKTSIILCSYNEANFIEDTINALKKNITNLEIVIVDDNSTDGTKEIINKLNVNNELKVIFRNKSVGLASAFLRGLIETTGDYIGWLDTNMSELAPRFVEMNKLITLQNDIVILSRYINGGDDKRNLLRFLSSKYFNIFCGILFRQPIKDYTTSIFLMKRNVINEVSFIGYGHGEFFIEFLYNAYKKGFKIKEIPFVQKKDSIIGVSKSAPNLTKFFYHALMYFLRVLITIVRRN